METTAMAWRQHISVDPAVCHAQACIKGTRIPVAAGISVEEALASSPPLRVDDVRAATAYAAELGRKRIVESAVAAWRHAGNRCDRGLIERQVGDASARVERDQASSPLALGQS